MKSIQTHKESPNGHRRNNEKSRNKHRSQNVITLLTPDGNCLQNLNQYINTAKKAHGAIFNQSIDWNNVCWNIKGFESTTRLRDVTHDSNILFTRTNGLKPKQKTEKNNEIPFLEPFASFAKALITHNHIASPKSHDTHMVTMRALRYLYEALPNKLSPCVSQLEPEHFNLALRKAISREKSSTLYVTGGKLAEVASRLCKYRLTASPIEWENPIPRDYKHGGASHNRGGKKAKIKRAQKLPKTEVLIFLSALWANYTEIEEKDQALCCMAIILMICGFRMDEFVGLDINCIPSRKEYEAQEYELDPETGTYTRILRIRALAKKKNQWDEKIVPPCAVNLIFEAVDRLKQLSLHHRQVAKMFLEEGKWERFCSYDDDDYLTAKEVKTILGFSGHSTSNVITTLQRYGVCRDHNSPKRQVRFRVGDIHESFYDSYIERISSIRDGIGHGELIVPVWELLTLRFKDQYTPKEKLNVFPEPLTGTQIHDFFRGRTYTSRANGEEKRLLNVFERYDFLGTDGIDSSLRTHQFRHLLNTLMQESDMFSQEDIAKNFLRKNVQDNSAYNHQIEPSKYAERTIHLQEIVLNKTSLDAEQARGAIQRFPLLSHEELQKDLDESGSYHFTDIGRCRHDYTQGQCGMHYMCLRGCVNYRRTKGNIIEIERIKQRREQTVRQMQLAKEDADENFEGASNWYLSHKELVEGCESALAIEIDNRFKSGDIIQVFPNGVDRCEEFNNG